ncbi:MAG: restriction endonuclease subunit R, partial [Gammaproteobacteria bacterium]|nr:restriction endonuclease subunit R [Gammaproteobacteria bacterium]
SPLTGEGWGGGEKPHSTPRMEWIPKTLIFAKDDDHCDRIVDVVREVFDEGNAFCKKITYKIGKPQAEVAIKAFRTDPQYRIAVTVDMIATGTDIKPLECVMFMRDVKSQSYYEQMKGRGTRVISIDELHKVTPDAPGKSRFVLVDCVGVTETDKTETKSLETKPSISTAKLMEQVARGDRHSETLRALGNRMIRLDLKLNDQQRKRVNDLIKEIVGCADAGSATIGATELLPPTTLTAVAANLIHATNEDKLIHAALKELGKADDAQGSASVAGDRMSGVTVTEQEIQKAFKPKADELIKPFHNPNLRELIEELRKNTDQLIDDSPDEIIDGTGYDIEKAEGLISNWQQFIQDHKNELDAIQLIYQQPYQKRHLSYEQIEKLAEEIQQPPYSIAPIEVWKAYEQLQKNKVKGVPAKELLTNIVSLIRFSTGLANELEPFPELVERRFQNWLKQQQLTPSPSTGEGRGEGVRFTKDQLAWLNKIKDQIAQNAEMTVEDFNYIPFNQEGGLLKERELFGKELEPLISELNGYLIA